MGPDEQQRIEGYWRRSEADVSDLPWPCTAPHWVGREAFVTELAALQAEAAANGGLVDYMGYSSCRICGRDNGASEFRYDGWVWPEGYRHYVEDHRIRPSPEFERFVLERRMA